MTEKQATYYELLILRCRRGRRDALEELVRRWEMRLFYYIRRLVEDEQDAWQVLQDTWVSVLGGIGKLRQPRTLPAWLYRIARNTAISHRRRNSIRQTLPLQDAAPDGIEESADGPLFEDAEQVHYGLARISLHHREVLTLFFLQDLSTEEIADVLEIPRGTVRSRLYHAKRALKAILEREERKYE
ncbi:MAG: RNA polymerase sigma factor [Phycisphaerales bacterium]|nr:MAG: RNA polymerase sigma factor [Phycisphaerales bacterium]